MVLAVTTSPLLAFDASMVSPNVIGITLDPVDVGAACSDVTFDTNIADTSIVPDRISSPLIIANVPRGVQPISDSYGTST
jgi:hypothetical protein